MKSYSICLSLSDLFHLAWCPQVSSVLLQMARFHSFLCLSNIPLCVYHIFFLYSPTNGYLVRFHILAIVNHTAVKTGVHISFQINALGFLDKYPEVYLLGHMIVLIFNFLRKLHIVIHSGCTNLLSPPKFTRVHFSEKRFLRIFKFILHHEKKPQYFFLESDLHKHKLVNSIIPQTYHGKKSEMILWI